MAKKRRTLGCLFYIALVLLVLVVFLFNRERVQNVLEKTGFTDLLQQKHEEPAEVVVTPLESEQEREEQTPAPETEPEEIVITVEKDPAASKPPADAPATTDPAASEPADRKPAAGVSAEKPIETPSRSRRSRLFFISVNDEGGIVMKGVVRAVEYEDAPLTATLQSLLQGPTTAEVNQGLMSLISPQTRLNSVYVKGDTAYIDFSEAFRFNSLGKEGLVAELKQVVYTATEFPTVRNVQILVDGQISKYLGPEGVTIDKPLRRDSF